MKVYISGAITGTTDYMTRFNNAQKYLEGLGFEVVNPALINSNLPTSTTWRQYMEVSVVLLSMCDHIYMLRGYETSVGANVELEKAHRMGLKILYEQTPVDMFPPVINVEKTDYIKNCINNCFGRGGRLNE